MVKYMRSEREGRVFTALGQPVRRDMVARLSRHGRMPLSTIAEAYDISLPAALKHMRILEQGGLVRHRKLGRKRFFYIDRTGFDAAEKWLRVQRRYWEGSFSRLEALLDKQK